MRFKIGKDLPLHWNNNCPVLTHIFNAIAILAPAFERLAITSLLPYQERLKDPNLKAQLKGFIGQESAHGSEFIRFNQILRLQGYDIKALEKTNLKQFKWLVNKFPAKVHLSLTLAAEHLTAIISDLILREPQWLSKAEPTSAALWRWHAIEEIEHKAVAYDVYHAVGGGYFTRLLGMGMMINMISCLLARNFFTLAKKDGLLLKLSFWCTLITTLLGKKGFLRKLFFPLISYMKPTFHPWKKDNLSLILKWKFEFSKVKDPNELVKTLQAHLPA